MVDDTLLGKGVAKGLGLETKPSLEEPDASVDYTSQSK